MISIKMFQGEWRLNIDGESWKFKSTKELEIILKQLINFKDNHGREVKWQE